VFATKEEQIPARVEMLRDTILRASEATAFGKKVFSRIDVLVLGRPSYPDADCGKTTEVLRQAYKVCRDFLVSRVSLAGPFSAAYSTTAWRCKPGTASTTLLSFGRASSYLNK